MSIFYRVSLCQPTTLPLPLSLQGRRLRCVAVFWRLSGNQRLTAGVSGAKAQERIEKGAELFTCRLGAFPRRALPTASFAKLPYMSANGLVS
jgi:hypothetical protein